MLSLFPIDSIKYFFGKEIAFFLLGLILTMLHKRLILMCAIKTVF